jgi:hypothetical protein
MLNRLFFGSSVMAAPRDGLDHMKLASKHCTANADRFTIEAKWLHGGRHR